MALIKKLRKAVSHLHFLDCFFIFKLFLSISSSVFYWFGLSLIYSSTLLRYISSLVVKAVVVLNLQAP